MFSICKIIVLSSLVIASFGCSPEFASPILHNDLTYMAKPMSGDSVQWGTYVGGNFSISNGFNRDDANTFCEINAYQSFTYDFVSMALGGFGYRGNYWLKGDSSQNFQTIQPYLGKYAYYGGGFRGSFNFTIPTDHIDIRVLGIDAVWSKEWGKYLKLRQTMQGLPDILSVTDDELLTLAFSQELCIRQRPETQLAIKWYFGRVFEGHLKSPESFGDASINFLSLSISYMHERFLASFQVSQMENYGAKFGLGYRVY